MEVGQPLGLHPGHTSSIRRIEAAMLSLIVTLQGFMVFAFAAVTGMEQASPRRLMGLLVGLIGVSLVLFTRFDMSNGNATRMPAVAPIETFTARVEDDAVIVDLPEY